jgi:hypothetical protein
MGGISEQEVNKHGTRAVILSILSFMFSLKDLLWSCVLFNNSSLEELFWSCCLDVLMKLGSINGPNPAIILFQT